MKRIKRSYFLIDRPFQIKYALFLSLCGGLVAALFASHIFYFLGEYFSLFMPGYQNNPNAMQFVAKEQKNILLYVSLLTLLVMSLLFFIGILVTHRMAGPVMVIRKKLEDLSGDNFSVRVRLRKGDEFKNLARAFNDLAQHLESKNKR